MTAALAACGLTKRFGSRLAVDGLDFEIGSGRVCGLLGRNGAGKTTTLRLLLGLQAATSGRATIHGAAYRDLPHPIRTVGAVLEIDAAHPGRRAIDHLRGIAIAAGLPRSRAEDVLGVVGLADAAGRRVGRFSLGMRQRLALAAAMMGDPAVLILDEPTNGLDPEGVAWLRSLLRRAAGEGRTVLVSSHLLAEMALTADELLIIDRGRRVAHAPVAELVGSGSLAHPERLSLAGTALEDAFLRLVEHRTEEEHA